MGQFKPHLIHERVHHCPTSRGSLYPRFLGYLFSASLILVLSVGSLSSFLSWLRFHMHMFCFLTTHRGQHEIVKAYNSIKNVGFEGAEAEFKFQPHNYVHFLTQMSTGFLFSKQAKNNCCNEIIRNKCKLHCVVSSNSTSSCACMCTLLLYIKSTRHFAVNCFASFSSPMTVICTLQVLTASQHFSLSRICQKFGLLDPKQYI